MYYPGLFKIISENALIRAVLKLLDFLKRQLGHTFQKTLERYLSWLRRKAVQSFLHTAEGPFSHNMNILLSTSCTFSNCSLIHICNTLHQLLQSKMNSYGQEPGWIFRFSLPWEYSEQETTCCGLRMGVSLLLVRIRIRASSIPMVAKE